MLRKYTVKSLRVLRLANQLMLCTIAAGAACGISIPRQTISRLYGLNFDCVTCNNAFYCTNKFFDPYLPIHYTTFMALRFVLRPFTLRIFNARRSYVKIFLRSKILIVFDCPQKVGKP